MTVTGPADGTAPRPAAYHPAVSHPRHVLVTSRSFASGSRNLLDELAAEGIAVLTGPADHDLATLTPLLAAADGWIAGTGPVTDAHLALAPHLRIVARYGVGVDAVDLAAATRRGVVVTNTPGANSGAVAYHAVALLLAALRGVAAGDRRVRGGSWTVRRSREVAGLTVGIVGFGRIGRGVAARLAGFGCHVIATDPFLPADAIAAAGATPVTADDLAARSDAVTLHAPGDQRIVDTRWLSRTRPGLILVNTARADLVDEAALAAALRNGTVAAYAADTLSTEGHAGAASPLLAGDLADRVTVTPHSAAQTVEAIDLMGGGAVAAVLAVLRGEEPDCVVNQPARQPA
jgi:D-3-phosphoglycerate dehydrogenase